MKPETPGIFAENMKTVLLWISIIYGARWIHRLLAIPLESTYGSYLLIHPARPFILLMFCISLFLMYKKPISIALGFFIVPMSFIIADIIHFTGTDKVKAFQILKFALSRKIISSTLAGCILIAIFELAVNKIRT